MRFCYRALRGCSELLMAVRINALHRRGLLKRCTLGLEVKAGFFVPVCAVVVVFFQGPRRAKNKKKLQHINLR